VFIPGTEKSYPIGSSIFSAYNLQTIQNQFLTELLFEQTYFMTANGGLLMTQARLIV
jgi:hypothetical protein